MAKRFENYVAIELKTMIELWNDSGIADFYLFFVRTKDGKETDFLITKDKKPWLLLDAKLKDGPISSHHFKHAESLGKIPFIQLVLENKIVKKKGKSFYSISASRFLK